MESGRNITGMFLWTKLINESSLTFLNLLDALRTEAVQTEVYPIVMVIFSGFVVRNPMVPYNFFSEIFANRQRLFLQKKYIAPLQLGKNWKARLIDDLSDIKWPPYWLPVKNVLGGH